MTVGELMAQLAGHNPDLPVRVIVEREFGNGETHGSVDVVAVEHVVRYNGTHVEVIGAR